MRALTLILLALLAAPALAQEMPPMPAPDTPTAAMPSAAPAKPLACKTTGEVANGDGEVVGLFVCQAGEWKRVPEPMLRKGLGDANWWNDFLVVISLVALAMFVAYRQTATMPRLQHLGTYLMVGSAVLGSVAFGVWQVMEGVSPIAILIGAGMIAGVGTAAGGAVGIRRAVGKVAKGGG